MDLAIYFGGSLGILALHNDNKPTTIHRWILQGSRKRRIQHRSSALKNWTKNVNEAILWNVRNSFGAKLLLLWLLLLFFWLQSIKEDSENPDIFWFLVELTGLIQKVSSNQKGNGYSTRRGGPNDQEGETKSSFAWSTRKHKLDWWCDSKKQSTVELQCNWTWMHWDRMNVKFN